MARATYDLTVMGTALRRLRLDRNQTQEYVSLESGLATPLISAGENGRRNLSFATLERWLQAMGASWEDFAATMKTVASQRGRAG